MDGPTGYPSNWPGARNQAAAPAPPPIEALQMAVDVFLASLSDDEFRALVARTRGPQ
jgi:hypothetical protein